MPTPRSRKPQAIVFAAASMFLIVTLLGGCIAHAARSDAKQDDPKATPTSAVEPRFDDFASKADPIPQREAVASKGDCAPRYRKAGLTGTCIEEKPCRGFGVLENGRAICTCYATRGGCAADERCEPRGAQCVKDDDSEPLGRSN
jgi:hypothetical protein